MPETKATNNDQTPCTETRDEADEWACLNAVCAKQVHRRGTACKSFLDVSRRKALQNTQLVRDNLVDVGLGGERVADHNPKADELSPVLDVEHRGP